MTHYQKEYDKIAWLDCDIVFENYNSIKLADELLNHKKLVQLYDKVIKLPHKDSEQTEAKYYTFVVNYFLKIQMSWENVVSRGLLIETFSFI